MRPDPVLAGLLRERAAEVGLPGPGVALEHHVLGPFDERAGAELGDHVSIRSRGSHPILPLGATDRAGGGQ